MDDKSGVLAASAVLLFAPEIAQWKIKPTVSKINRNFA
jgi:hypothetical protein